jgi:hypothetical protein
VLPHYLRLPRRLHLDVRQAATAPLYTSQVKGCHLLRVRLASLLSLCLRDHPLLQQQQLH